MKRDMDLIRKILIAVEDSESGWAPDELVIDGYSRQQVDYHALLLVEANLCAGDESTELERLGPGGEIVRLTWAGHEFQDAAKDQSRWEQVKKRVRESAGTVSFDVLKAALTFYALQSMGLK